MGQKVNPIGLRTGIIRNWDSRWYASRQDVAKLVKEDYLIRKAILKFPEYKNASISNVEIERVKNKQAGRIKIRLFTAKPGIVIGAQGETSNKVVEMLKKLTKKDVTIKIVEVKKPERNAQIVADQIAQQLENRASFRRVQKIAIMRALKAGALGIKTMVSGRLGGTDIARSEGYSEGRVPLATLKADVDYALAEAKTTYGILGVKVWIYNGDVLKGETREENIQKFEEKQQSQNRDKRPRRQNKQRGGE